MLVVKNKRKKVKVLKAMGKPALRLMPGLNNVDEKDLDDYSKGNPAAKAIIKKDLRIISDKLSQQERQEAKAAQEKNDLLNKSGLAIKKVQEALLKKEQESKDDKAKIADLEKSNADLLARFEKLEKSLEKKK